MSKSFDRLTLLNTFSRISDLGSITAAARDLGLAQPSVSRQLVELESRLKTELIRRTTHSLTLTPAGLTLLADARQMLDDWEALEEKHVDDVSQIKGQINVVAPVALGQTYLSEIATHFQIKHPEIQLSWTLDDKQIGFAESGCDCWIKVGPVSDESLIVRPIGKVERLVVSSKSIAKKMGQVEHPSDIAAADFVSLEPFEGGSIPLENHRGKKRIIKPPVRLVTNNILAVKQATLMGLGMSVLPKWFISTELEKGRLVDVLPNWRAPALNIQLAYLPSRYQPRRLAVFRDFIETETLKLKGIDEI